jgi:hypothetical protein
MESVEASMLEDMIHGCKVYTFVDLVKYNFTSKIYYGREPAPKTFITELPLEAFIFAEIYDAHFNGLKKHCEEIALRHGEYESVEDEDDAC